MMMVMNDGNFLSQSKPLFKIKLYFWKQFTFVYNRTAS